MSRIDELVAKLCPDGVTFSKLRQVAAYSDTRVDANDLDETTFVGVDNLLPNTLGRANATYLPNTARLTAYEVGDVLLGNIRPYLKKIWLATNNGGCSGDVLAVRIAKASRFYLMPEFLYYLLASDSFFAYDMQHAKGAKMPRGSKDAILNYRVPVPPLAIQREIVKVLDTFTELEARRRQYHYYRDALLNFAHHSTAQHVRWATLSEVCKSVTSGGTPLSTRAGYYNGDIPWLRTQEVRFTDIYDTEVKITRRGLEGSSAKWIPANCVIVAISGATAGRSAINKIPLTTNQHCCNLEIDPAKASYRYVFHWVGREYEKLKAFGQGARSDLNVDIIKKFRIPVPPLEVQSRIVAVLDKFDALVNDLSIGLPAELKARRQQYEYYRDRLLTFREAG